MKDQENVTLVVPGFGFKEPEERRGLITDLQYMSLSNTAKLRTLAAVERLTQGDVERVIFTGGHTGGRNWISEAKAMRDYAVRFSGDDSRTSSLLKQALLDEEAVDTAMNAEGPATMIDQGTNVEVITSASHGPRIRSHFKRLGIEAKVQSAELVAWQNPNLRKIVLTLLAQPSTLRGAIVEIPLNALLIPNPSGSWLRSHTQQRVL